jgi:hypothetical protein
MTMSDLSVSAISLALRVGSVSSRSDTAAADKVTVAESPGMVVVGMVAAVAAVVVAVVAVVVGAGTTVVAGATVVVVVVAEVVGVVAALSVAPPPGAGLGAITTGRSGVAKLQVLAKL